MVAFKDFMDKATFTWMDEVPKGGRGQYHNSQKKYEALTSAIESNPDKVMRLTEFYKMNMKHLATNYRKHLTMYFPDKKKYIKFQTRQEMVDGLRTRVVYFWVDMEEVNA